MVNLKDRAQAALKHTDYVVDELYETKIRVMKPRTYLLWLDFFSLSL